MGALRAEQSPATLTYVGVVLLAGAASIAVTARLYGAPGELVWLVPLLVLATLTRLGPRTEINGVFIFLTASVLLAAVALLGAAGAALVTVPPILVQYRHRLDGMAFNAGGTLLQASVGSAAYVGVAGGSLAEEPTQSPLEIGAALAAAAIGVALVNAFLVAGVLRFSSGARWSTTLLRLLRQMRLSYPGYAMVAFLLVVLWVPVGLGWFSAALMVPTLVLAQWGLTQYGQERRTHDRTLAALVAALELRIPGAAAHSVLVSDLSAAMAQELALADAEVDTVRRAGRLHDIGLLALPQEVRDPLVPIDPDTAAALLEHPARARDLLAEIAFLEPSLRLVDVHHERYDGSGYPHGTSGEQIPVGGRLLATADAFASFVMPRAPRPRLDPEAAVAACRALAGTALDPRCVEALARVVSRGAIEPPGPQAVAPGVEDDWPATWSIADHAHPDVTGWLGSGAGVAGVSPGGDHGV